MTMFSGHWDLVGSKVATVVSLAPCVGGTVSNTRAVAARAMSLDVAIRAASKWIFERFILPILLSPSRGAQPGRFVWFVIVLSSFLIVIVLFSFSNFQMNLKSIHQVMRKIAGRFSSNSHKDRFSPFPASVLRPPVDRLPPEGSAGWRWKASAIVHRREGRPSGEQFRRVHTGSDELEAACFWNWASSRTTR